MMYRQTRIFHFMSFISIKHSTLRDESKHSTLTRITEKKSSLKFSNLRVFYFMKKKKKKNSNPDYEQAARM